MTFEEFEAQAYREPDTGIYIVDGDTALESRHALESFYAAYIAQPRHGSDSIGTVRNSLIVNRVNGADDRWNDSTRMNLTYCVSTSFGVRYEEVLRTMGDAASAWEAVTQVRFVHDQSQDGACNAQNQNVLFDVRPTSNQPYLARAFFPSYQRSSRNILIDDTAFSVSMSLAGILRHELGHVLGFRHEHTRPEAGTCFEDNNWGDLTPYDRDSVMHYPQCNGNGSSALALTTTDAEGAAVLYGTPDALDQDPHEFDYNGDGRNDLFIHRAGQGATWVVHSYGNGSFTPVYASGWGIGGFDMADGKDRVIRLDYDGDGRDDLFLYRPGHGAAWVVRSNASGSFDPVYASGWGIGNFDMADAKDRAIRLDYNGDGRDDLFLYRPGHGAAWVVRSNGDGTFSTVYASGEGIGGFDLLDARDRVVRFDYDGDGRDDLFLYRPGHGAAWVVRSNGDGTFSTAYASGGGIAGYDLFATTDRVIPFDHNGDGKDDLLLYRPGRGAIYVAQSVGNGSFSTVFASGSGIGGFPLSSPMDRIVRFDYNGDGKDDLLLYRPGSARAVVVRSGGNGVFSTVVNSFIGIAGYDLWSPRDRAMSMDYDGDGKDDLVLYRPGSGAIFVAHSSGSGTFSAVHMVGDNGSDAPNGIADYDLLSVNDRIMD